MNVKKKYNERLDYLCSTLPEFNKAELRDIFIQDEENKDIIQILFPNDSDEIELFLTQEEIINQINEFENYQIDEKNSRIKTEEGIYYLCDTSNSPSFDFIEQNISFDSQYKELSLTINYDKRLLLGLISLKLNAYHEEYFSPIYYEAVIEINYHNKTAKENLKLEENAITSLRFELYANHNILIEVSEFDLDWDFEDEIEEEIISDPSGEKIELNPLIDCDEGLKMYLVAGLIYDSEFKFLSLYKIIEHYSPIALRTDAYEDLAKKLDSPKAIKPDGKYLGSILELASSFELRKRDRELIKVSLKKGIDIIDLKDEFPNFISNHLNGINLNYNSKKGEIDKAIGIIADVLYSTRNEFAHAKANFQPTGFECPSDDLDALNRLLKSIVIRMIKWYSRLPSHLKIKH